MKVIIDDKIPYLTDLLEKVAEVQYLPSFLITPNAVKDVDALIVRTRTICNAKLLDNSNVKFIGTATIGYDHIDVDYCSQNNIKWFNAPGCNSNSVNQYFCSAIIEMIFKYNLEPNRLNLGVVGYGNIGSKVYRSAQALGFNTFVCDPWKENKYPEIKFLDHESLLKKVDIITYHTPLAYSLPHPTYHLLNSNNISNCKSNLIVINSSRGEVISNDALKYALKQGLVRDGVIDVWENEPNIDKELLNLVSLATSHIAGYSADGKHNASLTILEKFLEFFKVDQILRDEISSEIPSLEVPKNHDILLDTKNSFLENCKISFIRSYDIVKDSNSLKNNPEKFESLRSKYSKNRRELSAFQFSPKINEIHKKFK